VRTEKELPRPPPEPVVTTPVHGEAVDVDCNTADVTVGAGVDRIVISSNKLPTASTSELCTSVVNDDAPWTTVVNDGKTSGGRRLRWPSSLRSMTGVMDDAEEGKE
jgi:hypothetical protein